MTATDGPMLCRWCLQRLAMVGLGSPYCEGCDSALHPEHWRAEAYERMSEWEKARMDMQEQRDFEHDHRAGADRTTDFSRGKNDNG